MAVELDSDLRADLEAVVGPKGLICAPEELLVYECDGYTIEKNRPDVVVFPDIDRAGGGGRRACCNEHDVPFLPRGAGTSLAGGCLPVGGGVMIVLTRMKRDPRRSTSATATPSSSRAWSTSG